MHIRTQSPIFGRRRMEIWISERLNVQIRACEGLWLVDTRMLYILTKCRLQSTLHDEYRMPSEIKNGLLLYMVMRAQISSKNFSYSAIQRFSSPDHRW